MFCHHITDINLWLYFMRVNLRVFFYFYRSTFILFRSTLPFGSAFYNLGLLFCFCSFYGLHFSSILFQSTFKLSLSVYVSTFLVYFSTCARSMFTFLLFYFSGLLFYYLGLLFNLCASRPTFLLYFVSPDFTFFGLLKFWGLLLTC